MIYRGHVQNGVVVLEDSVRLPDGLEVQVEVVAPKAEEPRPGEEEPLRRKLLKHSGKAVGLPTDMAQNHDHYLYGTPKH